MLGGESKYKLGKKLLALARNKKDEVLLIAPPRRNRETCTRKLSDKTPRSSLPYNIFRFLFLLEIRVASNI